MRFIKLDSFLPFSMIVEKGEDVDKLEFFYEHTECDCIDIVTLRHFLDGNYCMIVDDEGLLKENPAINPIASILYGVEKHGQPIVGNVLIGKNKFTEDGIETVGLEDEELKAVFKAINGIIDKALYE